MYTKKSIIKQCVGITSATVLMTMAVAAGTSHAADLKANQITNSQTTNNQDEVRQIVRTIKIDDPYKGIQTVKQVVEFKKVGSGWQATTPIFWPGYFAPNYDEFEPDTIQIKPQLITVNDKSETIMIKYHRYQLSERESLLKNRQGFYGRNDNFEYDNSFVRYSEWVKIGDWYEFPKPPKGYEYILSELLPKRLKMYHAPKKSITVLVQPIKKYEKVSETRKIRRPIIFNLPRGQKEVNQVIKLSREVTTINEHLNLYSNGPWKIEKEEKVEIPQVDSYTASMTQIPVFVIGESVKPVEVNYSLIKKEVNKSEDSSQTERGESQSTSTQTEGQKEQDSQTEIPTTSNNAVQTETNKQVDDTSQQTDSEQLSNKGTQITDNGKDNEAQTEAPSGKSEEIQTESNSKDENSQTESNHGQSTSVQTEELKQQDIQTEFPETSDEGTQTENSRNSAEKAQQTDQKLVNNQETQVNPVGKNKGTQIHKLTKVDQSTQSADLFGKSEESQTDEVSDKLDKNIQTEQKEKTNSFTQAIDKSQKGNSDKHSQTVEDENNYLEPQNKHDKSKNTEKELLDDSEIQKILDHDSTELKKLRSNQKAPSSNKKLPQTSNQTDNKTTIAGLGIISIITALTATFWKEKEKE